MFLVPAAVTKFNVREIDDENGTKAGKLQIKWDKPNGGDAITKFLVETTSEVFSTSIFISFVTGQISYEHNTTQLQQGSSVLVTISTINPAGNYSNVLKLISLGKVTFI